MLPKLDFEVVTPLVKSSHERSGIYSQYLSWCNLGTPDVENNILSGPPNSLT
jgi:hypothetical protein